PWWNDECPMTNAKRMTKHEARMALGQIDGVECVSVFVIRHSFVIGHSSFVISLPPGHRGDDGQLVAVLDRRGEVVEVTDVLVVEVDVDEAAPLAVVKKALDDAGALLAEVVEGGLHGAAADIDDRLAIGVLPHWGGNMNANRHETSKGMNCFRGPGVSPGPSVTQLRAGGCAEPAWQPAPPGSARR